MSGLSYKVAMKNYKEATYDVCNQCHTYFSKCNKEDYLCIFHMQEFTEKYNRLTRFSMMPCFERSLEQFLLWHSYEGPCQTCPKPQSSAMPRCVINNILSGTVLDWLYRTFGLMSPVFKCDQRWLKNLQGVQLGHAEKYSRTQLGDSLTSKVQYTLTCSSIACTGACERPVIWQKEVTVGKSAPRQLQHIDGKVYCQHAPHTDSRWKFMES